MPIAKIQTTDTILKSPSQKLRTIYKTRSKIQFPQSGILSKSKALKDFGGPSPNEVPDNLPIGKTIVGGGVGVAGGAAVGAIIGSVVPIVGTALGAQFGALIGAAAGTLTGALQDKDFGED